jgi:hypothetical protein
MDKQLLLAVISVVLAVAACNAVPSNNPSGSTPQQNSSNAAAPAPPQPAQVSGTQRLQYAWNKAMEGVVMGGALGGPYGAGGGFVMGLVAGLFMADSHYTALNNQIQSEQQKDQQLEAALEKELARQRDLEKQIATATTGTGPAQDSPEAQAGVANNPARPPSGDTAAANRPPENLASLSKPTAPQAAPPFKNVEVRDINGDGVPDSWLYYNPQNPGEIIRQEEASKGDGRVDTWSYFKDGRLMRREVDTRGEGRADSIFYYAGDKIVREERDENGQGRMNYRATFQDGRLAKVEKDTSGSGRTDLWVYYDTAKESEIVIKEEKDLNGDGVVDLWSHYDNGRLARRDVSAAGLEILSKEEQLPVSTAEVSQSIPDGS